MRIAGVVAESYVDGPGARYVLFVQGCSHHCRGCQNPDTWDYNAGEDKPLLDIADDIIQEFKGNPLLEGLTFSGGEPLDKADSLSVLVDKVKEQVGIKSIYCYTGYLFEDLINKSKKDVGILEFLKRIDYLVDGEFKLEQRCIHELYKGSSNQRIIDVQEWFKSGVLKSIEFNYAE